MAKSDETLTTDAVHGDETSTSFYRRMMDRFSHAWMFLTRVPLPKWWNDPSPDESVETDALDKGKGMIALSDTVRAWPVVGLLIGAVAGLVLWAGAQLGLHPMAAAFLGLTTGALITGALHEDGLADVADGFGGGASKAKKLAIMKDSHIGAYGVLALIMVIGF